LGLTFEGTMSVTLPLDDKAMAALGQLLGIVSRLDDEVIEASKKVKEAVQETLPQLSKQVEVLLTDEHRLEKSWLETTSQLDQTQMSGKALEEALAQKIGAVTSLQDETRQRILAANRAILNARESSSMDPDDVRDLLCAYHGIDLLYELESFKTVRSKTLQGLSRSKMFIADVLSHFCLVERKWLQEHFFPNSTQKSKGTIPPLRIEKISRRDIEQNEETFRQRYVTVRPFGIFPINPTETYFPAKRAVPVVQANEALLEWRKPELSAPPEEPPVSNALVLAPPPKKGDSFLDVFDASSDQLMREVHKTQESARNLIPRMERRIGTLVTNNQVMTQIVTDASRKLSRVIIDEEMKAEARKQELVELPQKMEEAQKLCEDAMRQTNEKVDAEYQGLPQVQFQKILIGFFGGKLEKAIAALDKLAAAVAKDPRFDNVNGKNRLLQGYAKRKQTWTNLKS